jgi:hypothetical protein
MRPTGGTRFSPISLVGDSQCKCSHQESLASGFSKGALLATRHAPGRGKILEQGAMLPRPPWGCQLVYEVDDPSHSLPMDVPRLPWWRGPQGGRPSLEPFCARRYVPCVHTGRGFRRRGVSSPRGTGLVSGSPSRVYTRCGVSGRWGSPGTADVRRYVPRVHAGRGFRRRGASYPRGTGLVPVSPSRVYTRDGLYGKRGTPRTGRPPRLSHDPRD